MRVCLISVPVGIFEHNNYKSTATGYFGNPMPVPSLDESGAISSIHPNPLIIYKYL